MNHKLQRILVLLLVAALVVALPAFSAAAADVDPVEEEPKAAGDAAPAAPPLADLTLKVHKGDTDAMADLANATVTFDLYKIADAVLDDEGHGATFKFANVNSASGLASDALDYDKLPKATDDPSTASTFWEGIRSTAATSILPEGAAAYAPTASKAAGVDEDLAEITPLAGGLYLIVARDTEASYADYWDTNKTGEVVTKAFSDEHIYTYLPQLVVLPGTEDGTTAGGKWVDPYEVYMKPAESDRLGNLKITKTLDNIQAGSQATFVFHVVATTTKDGTTKTVYDKYVSLTFSAAGTKTYEILRAIPAGAQVTVTEEYDGTRFSPVGSAVAEGKIPGPEKDPLTLSFENAYNGKIITGYGIENRFSFSQSKSDWEWVQNPNPVIEGEPEPAPKEEDVR